MLVQDYVDKVYILPAVSQRMPEGVLKGLRLKAGAILNMSWQDCQLTDIEIIATRPIMINLLIDDEIVSISLKANERFQQKAMCHA